MIFGIDFGTTHTVVSWVKEPMKKSVRESSFEDENVNNGKYEIEFLYNYDGQVLQVTEINGMKNIKRAVAENSQSLEFNQSEIYTNIKQFFLQIREQIQEQITRQSNDKRNELNNQISDKTKNKMQTPLQDYLKDISNIPIQNIAKSNGHAHEQETTVESFECVLSVPARFDDIARNAIKCAAIWAGFNVLKLITEPVAAAIASVNDKRNGYYFVYDLGGGTFDISLLKFENGVFQILAIDGLANFGGLDIDVAISEYFKIDLEKGRVYKEAGDFALPIEKMINEMLKKTYDIVFEVLKENGINESQIVELILVGGSSRLAMIEQFFAQHFKVSISKNPDYIVSVGAAIHGFELVNNQNSDHLLIDAIPFNLGLEVLGNKVEILIPKNSALPYAKEEYFYPKSKNVQINILQGIGENADEYVRLGSLELDFAGNNNEKFSVTFMLDYDGIFSIKVLDHVFTLSMRNYVSQADAEVMRMIDLIQQFIKKNQNQELAEENNYIKLHKTGTEDINFLNHEQYKFMEYLEQAKSIPLSNLAREWLVDRFNHLFADDIEKI